MVAAKPQIILEPGQYIVAVSGGVDSVVLLDLLTQLPGLKLTVAHFDHGIRPDSKADRLFVQSLAQAHRLPFSYDRAELGPGASEAIARQARYQFLNKVRRVTGARSIITAHHADDRLETAIINVLRGTGRRGLSALKSNQRIARPLLGYSKQQLRAYAQDQNLRWHEDSTNQDDRYLRNYIRHQILNKFSKHQRQQLTQHILVAQKLNQQLDNQLVNFLHLQPAAHNLDRDWFISLPHIVAREVLASWLREHDLQFDSKTLERLVVATKTYPAGKRADVNQQAFIDIGKSSLALSWPDR